MASPSSGYSTFLRLTACNSKRFDPLLRGRTERFGGWLDSLTPMGLESQQNENVLGSICYTVSDDTGGSVTVSKWGVD